jgi:hypothetical protein
MEGFQDYGKPEQIVHPDLLRKEDTGWRLMNMHNSWE